ncbi:bifunctional 3'-5' exonuclease/DNA polymerase [Couchioplanes azureus]|uniref:bifunctional 3'-5' exonuclease/DNA polymerase n=1 Tax=Couchioplanes caeruleus TaxID=56438 RepID=UPI0019C19192|nr:bifunctional 3'-5' exonuclease/DNA polymerase [Couchioplanes caeruleus]GGQ50465.1 DNA polymerase I [Couchioplanes caeruleus subsp. azureus]
MLVAVVSDDGSWRGRGRLQPLAADGTPASAPEPVADLPAAIAAREAADRPRWVWASTAECYPVLLRAGVRVGRCHDVELTEALLLGHAGRWGEPRSLAAASARLTGAPVPPDPPPRAAEPPGFAQGALFEATHGPPAADGPVLLHTLTEVYADQHRRITAAERSAGAVASPGGPGQAGAGPPGAPGRATDPGRAGASGRAGRFSLLVAAESAGALVGAEMGHAGLPWRGDIHDELLRDLLGPPQPVGPPRRLAELTAEINAAFGMHGLHPDSPAEVLRAFARAGIDIPNTRAWVLRRVDHPAVKPLLEYKELYRIWTAHGWAWRDAWVSDGRFRPEYVPGGVVSGRWATRGGGALQVPKVVRRAVVADPGWRFVVADAGQLEPRVLAAVSGDTRLAAAGEADDLYAALAADAFAGDRPRAKVALLGAMYGQTGGAAIPALAVLRQSYPTAFEYVEAAARTGEAGGLVRSWLGRTCPPASTAWRDAGLDPPEEAGSAELPQGGATGRARGRFTRNFVIQATAAEWALVLLATLRTALCGMRAEIVLFVHDEVGVHCPKEEADQVVEAVHAAAAQAGRLLFGDTAVRFPLDVSVVECYADAA